MKRLMLSMVLALAISGCMERDQPGKSAAEAKLPAADVAAGKAFAERECKACHGLDGRGAAPAIPHLAAQRERYLLAALKALPDDADGEAIQTQVYEVGKRHPFPDLRAWFRALYEILLGQSEGPRMGSFIELYGLPETRQLVERAIAGEDLAS